MPAPQPHLLTLANDLAEITRAATEFETWAEPLELPMTDLMAIQLALEETITNVIDFGMNVQAAGDAARVRHSGSADPSGIPAKGAGTVFVESGIADEAIEQLRGLGHSVVRARDGYGGYQGIWIDWENTGIRISLRSSNVTWLCHLLQQAAKDGDTDAGRLALHVEQAVRAAPWRHLLEEKAEHP